MLFQVGGQGTRPTFFEMAAAQQLPSSLRAALTYSIGVMALRRPILHKVLDYENEFFALLMLVLETHSMRTTDASFSESLYGLRRRTVKLKLKKDALHSSSTDGIQLSGIEKHQRVLSVVFLVVLPYFKSKLHSIYSRERETAVRASLWGPGDESFDDADYLDVAESPVDQTRTSDQDLSSRERILQGAKKIIAACYPWIHTGHEGIQVGRATGQELMDASSRISRMRSRERERLRGPPWLKKLQGALLSCMYAALDYSQTGLIAAVFVFKMMEWWYQSAEERMSAPTIYPPPPPPPAPKAAKEGIPLPSDRTVCPLCSERRANPSVVTVSGFVFCYGCIFKYVSQYKLCPVTLIPAEVEDIRRLFHDM
ncbi:peroxisome biogenesis protein 12 isoform X2 [Chenopodium quinoa]|uniref:peroxisome biogenesis protein 12 isoform X2 n=1 Tax=Chenopodium quinoa TaxID=63459 RepID=UPI000B792BB4|nr:peroxisome biogenesis protein 12 isoform X2 [Chenopodium quinoa]